MGGIGASTHRVLLSLLELARLRLMSQTPFVGLVALSRPTDMWLNSPSYGNSALNILILLFQVAIAKELYLVASPEPRVPSTDARQINLESGLHARRSES